MAHEEKITRILRALSKDYVVVGKRRVKSWKAWTLLGLAAGVVIGVILVANRSGEFYSSKAAPGGGGGGGGGTSTTTQLVAPTNLQAAASIVSQQNQIALTWSDSNPTETGVSLERSLGAANSFAVLATVPQGTTSYTDTNLPSNTAYDYRLRAYIRSGRNNYMYSPYSNVVNTTTSTTSTVGFPAPTLVTLSDYNAEISITPSTDPSVIGYNLYRNNSFVTLITPQNLKIIDTTLDTGTSYVYAVAPIKADGTELERSSNLSFTTMTFDTAGKLGQYNEGIYYRNGLVIYENKHQPNGTPLTAVNTTLAGRVPDGPITWGEADNSFMVWVNDSTTRTYYVFTLNRPVGGTLGTTPAVATLKETYTFKSSDLISKYNDSGTTKGGLPWVQSKVEYLHQYLTKNLDVIVLANLEKIYGKSGYVTQDGTTVTQSQITNLQTVSHSDGYYFTVENATSTNGTNIFLNYYPPGTPLALLNAATYTDGQRLNPDSLDWSGYYGLFNKYCTLKYISFNLCNSNFNPDGTLTSAQSNAVKGAQNSSVTDPRSLVFHRISYTAGGERALGGWYEVPPVAFPTVTTIMGATVDMRGLWMQPGTSFPLCPNNREVCYDPVYSRYVTGELPWSFSYGTVGTQQAYTDNRVLKAGYLTAFALNRKQVKWQSPITDQNIVTVGANQTLTIKPTDAFVESWDDRDTSKQIVVWDFEKTFIATTYNPTTLTASTTGEPAYGSARQSSSNITDYVVTPWQTKTNLKLRAGVNTQYQTALGITNLLPSLFTNFTYGHSIRGYMNLYGRGVIFGNDASMKAARLIYSLDNHTYDIHIHGLESGDDFSFKINDLNVLMTAEDLADTIKNINLPSPYRLLACRSGMYALGGAQKFANAVGVATYAANNYVIVGPFIEPYISAMYIWPFTPDPNGAWKWFYPTQ